MTPKQDAQLLVDELLPFAKLMLGRFGEFHPFGGRIAPDGSLVHVGARAEEESAPSQEEIAVLEEGLRSEASSGAIRAAAIVVNVAVKPPGGSGKVDAIEIRIDHRDGYSVSVFFPYAIEDDNVTTSQPFVFDGVRFAFGARAERS